MRALSNLFSNFDYLITLLQQVDTMSIHIANTFTAEVEDFNR